MTAPYSRSNSVTAVNAGPSRTLLHQLLEEISGALTDRTARNESISHSPSSTKSWSSSQAHSPSVWVGGSSIAQHARDKLRAADEVRLRSVATSTTDGASDLQTSMLRLDTPRLDATLDQHEKGLLTGSHQTPDPVRCPYDYMQHMMKGSLISTAVGLSPAANGHDNTPFHLQAPPFGDDIPRCLSPLIFSDVEFDDSPLLSPQTEPTASPTEAPTSAATVYTVDGLQTPIGIESKLSCISPCVLAVADVDIARKRTHFFDDSTSDMSPQKRRTMALPDIRGDACSKMAIDAPHCFIDVVGDNQSVLREKTFSKHAPTPRILADLSTIDELPELSSFRPTVADSQGQPALKPSSQKLARALTSSAEPANSTIPDLPAWMQPMHLIDTGGKSIYTNVHDDGPIRHALCLWCFRANGNFRKVDRRGYESCGRKEVLDSHYWEDDTWPEESSDESTSSGR